MMRRLSWLPKSAVLLGLSVIVLGCATQKMQNERYLTHELEITPYHYQDSFQCVTSPKPKYSKRMKLSFSRAEEVFDQWVPLEEKIRLYQESLALGDTRALSRMLKLYQAYDAIAKKQPNYKSPYDEKILELYHDMLVERSLPEGYTEYAKLKRDGILVYKDESVALDYINHAAKLGDSEAQVLLGDHYMYKEGDYFKGKKAYECAAKQDNVNAYHALAVAAEIFEENYAKSLHYHEKAAALGSLKSIIYLRSVFRDGLYGYDKDFVLTSCFHNFYEEYYRNPSLLHGFEGACPIPDHPSLADGNLPLDDEQLVNIRSIEYKFNPHQKRAGREAVVIHKKINRDNENRKQLLRALQQNNESRF